MTGVSSQSPGSAMAYHHMQQYQVPHGMFWGSEVGSMQGVYPHGVQQVGPMVVAPSHQMMYTTGHAHYGPPTGMHYVVPGNPQMYPPHSGSHRQHEQG